MRAARIIHERFCCNCGFTATTSLSAGGLAARSVDILFKDASLPHGSARKTRPPHRLSGVRKRDAHYSSRRGPGVATPPFRDEPS